MDDDMEIDIIREVFFTHFHLIWKYVTVTSSGLIDMILPGPEESFKSKIFQPGPFMILTFIIIISSIVLQAKNNLLQRILLSCHRTIILNVVADRGLKGFVSASIGNENISQELTEGIVGVYALQGRRGTMEDRFSVMQEVDVGGSNKPSFYGVYDGHGGQFVAEYVKQNLFHNTVQKIRQARISIKEKIAASNGIGSDKRRKSCNPAPPPTLSTSSSSNSLNTPSGGIEKRPSSGSLKKDANLNLIKENEDVASDTCKEEKEKEHETIEKGVTQGCGVEEVKIVDEKTCETKKETSVEKSTTESLKKEDPYSFVNFKKRNSVAATNDPSTNKDSLNRKKESFDTNSYIDVNSNVNYSKLLSDQIMDIDNKIVHFCKSKTDLSGTTAVVAVLDGELLIIGNVGDSRAVMGDLKGSTIPLSFDHKPNQLKERRRIKEAGGFITFTGVWRVAGILATSRALGDFPLKDPKKLITAEPDVLTFSLKDHKAHFVILATDGLWDVLTNEDAVAFVKDHIQEPDNGAQSLVLHAYNKGSQDNITAMILNLSKVSL